MGWCWFGGPGFASPGWLAQVAGGGGAGGADTEPREPVGDSGVSESLVYLAWLCWLWGPYNIIAAVGGHGQQPVRMQQLSACVCILSEAVGRQCVTKHSTCMRALRLVGLGSLSTGRRYLRLGPQAL